MGRQTATGLAFGHFPRGALAPTRESPPGPPRIYYNLLILKEKERAGHKPGSVVGNHSSGTTVAGCLKQPTREPAQARGRGSRPACSPIWSCSRRGLPCHGCYQPRGALLPHHFTLTGRKDRRYLFCGTFHGLAPSRRYLAPCLMEPGLSSGTEVPAIAWPTLTFCPRIMGSRMILSSRQDCSFRSASMRW
jgi:hypothetical protein